MSKKSAPASSASSPSTTIHMNGIADSDSFRRSPSQFTTVQIEVQIKFLLGQVLTIVDAAIADHRQCKATKDLVRDAFISKLTHIRSLVGANAAHGL